MVVKLSSMRVRLAAWCLLVLGAGMGLFAVAIFVAVRSELMEGVHESLIANIRSCQLFLEQESRGTDLDAIREEAREYSTGLPAGHRLVVRTPDGAVLFASPAATTNVYEISQHIRVRGHALTIAMDAPLDQVHETLAVLRDALVVRLPLMLAVAIVGAAAIAKRALRPVDEMTADAQAIGMNDLSRRLVVRPTGDELERLGIAWNTMLDRLAASVQQMKRFTTDAAQELRTPLSIIGGTAELALRKERDAASYQKALSAIQQETLHLTRVVEKLMRP
jgi:signal transduction histidine kinase